MINENTLQRRAEMLWQEYCEIFPRLVKFDCPKLVINGRFKTTAGICYVSENRVELAKKFLLSNAVEMVSVTLPHELAHQIDYNLNGWPKNNRWHGATWKNIMVKIGQKPDLYHTM